MEVKSLKPTLKGILRVQDEGGGGAGVGYPAATVNPPAAAGVRWRVAQVGRKLDAQRRLVIFRGYARADNGRLQAQHIRAMLDSGAQAEIISPALVKRLGGTITEGRFGVAVEAFGCETPLTQQARGIHLQLPGTNPRSLLAQDFTATWDFIVAPRPLSSHYDMLLGVQFMRRFQLSLSFQKPCSVRLTAVDGRETMVTEEEEEHIEAEAEEATASAVSVGPAKVGPPHRRWMRPLTNSQRRAIRREWREGEEWRLQQAARAASDPSVSSLVMSMEELERLWTTSAPGSVKIFAMQARGFVETEDAMSEVERDGSEVRVGAVATGGRQQQQQQQAESVKDGSHLPLNERPRAERMVSKLQREFADVFPDELPSGVPPTRGSEPFRIDLKEGTKPFGRYGPRMTAENTLEAEKMLKELLAKGFIRPSRSPWGSPMFLVDKPDGGKRMVIDYRGLNAATTRNRYPLPRIDELFDQLQGARYFSKLDLRTGYWQIRVASEDVAKTAFTSRHGHFEWLVLPMGLTNAPAEFMALMENTFRDELNKFVLVFLDDILVYSSTMEEHERHLRVVLTRLREQKLYAKWSKCTFVRQEVEFLGHFVGRAGVRMVEGKVAAVERWPTPTSQKEVEQFLGLAGYYRRFIEDFSKISSPLSELCGTLKKPVGPGGAARRAPPKKKFYWGVEQQEAFDALKRAVTSAPCLAIPDPAREFLVHTDSSGFATGAVLMQRFDAGLRPIAFLSKKMSPAERRYPVHEQELLAILNALKAWRHYLGGRHFTVLTDHQSLQYVETSVMATPRQMRWAAWLSEFDFSIRYGRGKDNVAADALSRAAAAGTDGVDEDSGGDVSVGSVLQLQSQPRLLINSINDLAPLPVRVREAAQGDAAYQALLKESAGTLERKGMVRVRGLLYRVRAKPGEERPEDGPAAEQDEEEAPVTSEVRDIPADEGQLVVPKDERLRTWLLSTAHDTLLGGHHSAATTHAWLRERVWWSNMAADAQRYVRGCELCQRNKPDLRGRQGLPMSIATPSRAWEVICLDFIGPLPRTARGCDVVLVVIDKLTRWVYYIPMRQTDSAQDVFALLDRHVLANHDTPRQIISDRDSRFTSRFWEAMWAAMRVGLKRSTAFHPQTDGATERANRTLIEQLRSHVDEHQADWDVLLPQLQRANNSSVCVSTGYSPFEMNYGRRVRTELDAELEREGVAEPAVAAATYPGAEELAARRVRAEAAARVRIAKAQQKQQRDAQRGRRAGEVAPGDRVWLSNRNLRLDEQGRARKLEPLYFGPYDVLELHGSNAARLRLPAGCRLHPVFNLDLLRKFVDGRAEFPERPVRDHRPGPVQLEEDAAAGGPGEPEYEVEAIIGSRGRGARMSYRVKWLGWPVEQASWCPAAECRVTCPERVREYEERELRRVQAVQVIRAVEVERREQRSRWAVAAAGVEAEHRDAEQPENEAAREIVVAACPDVPSLSAVSPVLGAATAGEPPSSSSRVAAVTLCVGEAKRVELRSQCAPLRLSMGSLGVLARACEDPVLCSPSPPAVLQAAVRDSYVAAKRTGGGAGGQQRHQRRAGPWKHDLGHTTDTRNKESKAGEQFRVCGMHVAAGVGRVLPGGARPAGGGRSSAGQQESGTGLESILSVCGARGTRETGARVRFCVGRQQQLSGAGGSAQQQAEEAEAKAGQAEERVFELLEVPTRSVGEAVAQERRGTHASRVSIDSAGSSAARTRRAESAECERGSQHRPAHALRKQPRKSNGAGAHKEQTCREMREVSRTPQAHERNGEPGRAQRPGPRQTRRHPLPFHTLAPPCTDPSGASLKSGGVGTRVLDRTGQVGQRAGGRLGEQLEARRAGRGVEAGERGGRAQHAFWTRTGGTGAVVTSGGEYFDLHACGGQGAARARVSSPTSPPFPTRAPLARDQEASQRPCGAPWVTSQQVSRVSPPPFPPHGSTADLVRGS